ncbi:hypothetical protein ES702_05957 [subsurface metagenome]
MPYVSSPPIAFDNVTLEIVGGIARIKGLGVDTAQLAAAAVSTVKLKTAMSAVSVGSNSTPTPHTLPGGEYGFYPQVKMSATGGHVGWCAAITAKEASITRWTTYRTNIDLAGGAGAATMYAQQRYITASGKDHWLFILWDKTPREEKIISAYEAPDHPCFGNGDDENKIPHPFGNYHIKKLPAHLEIILVDLATTYRLKELTTKDKDLLTIVNERYLPDLSKTLKFEGRDFGWFDGSLLKPRHRIIKTIAPYIKVRGLVKK